MKDFIGKDFLLSTKMAQRLYHEAAAEEPVFDYHCHLNPKEIAEDRRFDNLADIWLAGDHYKWRAMRANGIDEAYITGNAGSYEKFQAWARTVPLLIGNPLYHWTHLELQRYFDFYEPFNEANAEAVWNMANKKLQHDEGFSVYGIFKKFNVFAVGTTDDPVDSLEYHQKIVQSGKTATKVLPSFRPDNVLDIEKDSWRTSVGQLGAANGTAIHDFDAFMTALCAAIERFDHNGCLIADHGMLFPPFAAADDGSTGSRWEAQAAALFGKRLDGAALSETECELFKSCTLCLLAAEYAKHGWTMQLHLSPLRAINSVQTAALGINTGFDVMADRPIAEKVARLLDAMESRNALPKTILYSLNPKDFYILSAIGGSFQGTPPGKIQLGSAWWFLDNKDEMEAQMRILANTGVLPRFVGMLTDSRSFLSYPRHEYFRRILCRLLGFWAEEGEINADFTLLASFVRDISFRNARQYFSR